jgi:hypothetical protein
MDRGRSIPKDSTFKYRKVYDPREHYGACIKQSHNMLFGLWAHSAPELLNLDIP